MNFPFPDGEYKMTVSNGRRSVKYELICNEPKITLEDIWKPGAPISYPDFISLLMDEKLINSDYHWICFDNRGRKPTSARWIKGLYQFLEKSNCIPPLSMQKVMEIFNTTFNAQINYARVLQGDCDGDPDFYFDLFNLRE
jgi:hypothetical protein